MKIKLTAFILLGLLVFAACKKDKTDPKPEVADISFTLIDCRPPGDTLNYSFFNYPSSIILHSDYTWTLDLDGAVSNGTYTWMPTTYKSADIKMTIQQWTPLSSNTALSDKLKLVIQSTDNCTFPDSNPLGLYLLNVDYTVYLRTLKM